MKGLKLPEMPELPNFNIVDEIYNNINKNKVDSNENNTSYIEEDLENIDVNDIDNELATLEKEILNELENEIKETSYAEEYDFIDDNLDSYDESSNDNLYLDEEQFISQEISEEELITLNNEIESNSLGMEIKENDQIKDINRNTELNDTLEYPNSDVKSTNNSSNNVIENKMIKNEESSSINPLNKEIGTETQKEEKQSLKGQIDGESIVVNEELDTLIKLNEEEIKNETEIPIDLNSETSLDIEKELVNNDEVKESTENISYSENDELLDDYIINNLDDSFPENEQIDDLDSLIDEFELELENFIEQDDIEKEIESLIPDLEVPFNEILDTDLESQLNKLIGPELEQQDSEITELLSEPEDKNNEEEQDIDAKENNVTETLNSDEINTDDNLITEEDNIDSRYSYDKQSLIEKQNETTSSSDIKNNKVEHELIPIFHRKKENAKDIIYKASKRYHMTVPETKKEKIDSPMFADLMSTLNRKIIPYEIKPMDIKSLTRFKGMLIAVSKADFFGSSEFTIMCITNINIKIYIDITKNTNEINTSEKILLLEQRFNDIFKTQVPSPEDYYVARKLLSTFFQDTLINLKDCFSENDSVYLNRSGIFIRIKDIYYTEQLEQILSLMFLFADEILSLK